MRGFCFNRFRKITSVVIAAFISAVMFGILHMNINQMCYAIVLGVVFSLANFASGSIWTSVIMHMVINGFGMVVLYAMQTAMQSAGMDLAEAAEVGRTSGNMMLYTGLVLLVISIFSAFFIRLVLKKIAVIEGNQEAIYVLFSKREPEKASIA